MFSRKKRIFKLEKKLFDGKRSLVDRKDYYYNNRGGKKTLDLNKM